VIGSEGGVTGREVGGLFREGDCVCGLALGLLDVSQKREGIRVGIIGGQRLFSGFLGAGPSPVGILDPLIAGFQNVGLSQKCPGGSKIRVPFKRFAIELLGLDHVVRSEAQVVLPALEHRLVRFEVVGLSAPDPLLFLRGELNPQRRHYSTSDLILHVENFFQLPLVVLGPHCLVARGIAECCGHVDPLAGLLHAALQHVTHVEFCGDLGRRFGPGRRQAHRR
jgi:hypothetical protein